jgi:hypothetical protein
VEGKESPAGLETYFEEFSRQIAEAPDDLARRADLAGRDGRELVL